MPETGSQSGTRVWLGSLAVLFYLVNGTYQLLRGFPENSLWVCHLGSLVVGLGLLSRSASLNLIGIQWLSVGTPLWLFNLISGGELFLTSTLTHLGGPVMGLLGIRHVGLPRRRVWWIAILGTSVLHFVSRWAARPEYHINLAGGFWPGTEPYFASYEVFLLSILLLCAAVFLALELLLHRSPEIAADRTAPRSSMIHGEWPMAKGRTNVTGAIIHDAVE